MKYVSVGLLLLGLIGCIRLNERPLPLGGASQFAPENKDNREVPPPTSTKPWDRLKPALVSKFGCQIYEADHMWFVDVWADRKGLDEEGKPLPQYKLWLSVRGSRSKAMQDCDKWMKEATKRIAEAQNGQVRK